MNSVHLEDQKSKTLDLHVGYSTGSRKAFHLCFLTSFIARSKISSVCHKLKRLCQQRMPHKCHWKKTHQSPSFVLVLLNYKPSDVARSFLFTDESSALC